MVGQGRVPLSEFREPDLFRRRYPAWLHHWKAQPQQRSGRRELSLLESVRFTEAHYVSVPPTRNGGVLFSSVSFDWNRCHLLPLKPPAKQTVDGSHAALEIFARSSYVPAFCHRRPVPVFPGDARPTWRASTRLEMPIWMKCSGRSANRTPAHRARSRSAARASTI